MDVLETALSAVVAGDMAALPAIMSADQVKLQRATANLPLLSVSRSALVKVLSDWRNGQYVADNVQQGASFV